MMATQMIVELVTTGIHRRHAVCWSQNAVSKFRQCPAPYLLESIFEGNSVCMLNQNPTDALGPIEVMSIVRRRRQQIGFLNRRRISAEQSVNFL